MPTAPITDFADVQPGQVYTTADLCRLLGISENTALGMIASGRVKTLPRLAPRTPHRILGSALLGLLGDQAATLPVASETVAQRKARVSDDLVAIRHAARRRPATAT